MPFLILSLIVLFLQPPRTDFKSSQLKFSRVQQAYKDKNQEIGQLLQKNKIARETMQIFIRVFKREKTVELWAKNKGDRQFILLRKYPFCASSGDLGPKRSQGDGQIPEGFYTITAFNPESEFYLSLGISYPNQSDRILSKNNNPGGDIFIHGNCVTIGCIPITDDKIKELYLFAMEAKNNGQENIPVHIFPTPLTNENLSWLETHYKSDPGKILFWKNLKEGFNLFETSGKISDVSILKDGKYLLK
jgi:murein L,D-transpeptidase YafK